MNHHSIVTQRMAKIPLTIYIHFPWCLSKCPYCDFNSYTLPKQTLISAYVDSLLADLAQESSCHKNSSKISSIYFGGGTASLLKPVWIKKILARIKELFQLSDELEITLEANPGTIDIDQCWEWSFEGVNRISLGVQSFNQNQLTRLGRIHTVEDNYLAIEAIKNSGITNFNLDLMFGLPYQTPAEALTDLKQSCRAKPSHISWYQLTWLKPIFKLPAEEVLWKIAELGNRFLVANGWKQYEVAAYCRNQKQRCRHHVNYWEYGDYIGVGAGSHSKITDRDYQVVRYVKFTDPVQYLQAEDFIEVKELVQPEKLPLEFMLNSLRLYQPIRYELFQERTGLKIEVIKDKLVEASQQGLIKLKHNYIITTPKGKNFLNNLLMLFV